MVRDYIVTYTLPGWPGTDIWIARGSTTKEAEELAAKEITDLYKVAPLSVKASTRKVNTLDRLSF